jgi:hypothetical protein
VRITCRRPQHVPWADDGFVRKWYTHADYLNNDLSGYTVVQIYQWIPYRSLRHSASRYQCGRWVDRGRATLRNGESLRAWFVRYTAAGILYASVLDFGEAVDKYDQLYAFTLERSWAYVSE